MAYKDNIFMSLWEIKQQRHTQLFVIRLISCIFLLFSLVKCTSEIPITSTDEPAAEIINSRISEAPAKYYFDTDLMNVTGFVHIQQFSLQISPGKALIHMFSNAILAAYPNAIFGSDPKRSASSKYNFYFTLDSFDPEFTYTRSFLDLSDTIHTDVSITIFVRVANENGEDIYRGIIYGDDSRELQSDTSLARQELSQTTDEAIQRIGDDFVQKVLLSSALAQSRI